MLPPLSDARLPQGRAGSPFSDCELPGAGLDLPSLSPELSLWRKEQYMLIFLKNEQRLTKTMETGMAKHLAWRTGDLEGRAALRGLRRWDQGQ